jgi:chloramphenicol O-acetyltransferase
MGIASIPRVTAVDGEVLVSDNVPCRLKLMRSTRHYISVLDVNVQEEFTQNRQINIDNISPICMSAYCIVTI